MEYDKSYIKFLEEVLQSASRNSEAWFLLASKNSDKLNDALVFLLKDWAKNGLLKFKSEERQYLAAAINKFSHFIQDFNGGNKRNNLEIAITGYEIAADIFNAEECLQNWATIQDNLGKIHCNRLCGERSENIERAITFLQLALSIRTYESFPDNWASTQNNLGIAYLNRLQGDKPENLEKAICAFRRTLKVWTRKAFPEEWAMSLSNLSSAYSLRMWGKPVKNQAAALALLQLTLQVITRSEFPLEWAGIQLNLCSLYRKQAKGDRERNLDAAINAGHLALEVYKCENFQEQWAQVQYALGAAYCLRADHYKKVSAYWNQDLDAAVTAYNLALKVYTPETHLEMWASTHYDLGLILADRGKSLDAIKCFKLSLRVYKPSTYPWESVSVGHTLGRLAASSGLWDEAIEGYSVAINGIEQNRCRMASDGRRRHILAAYSDTYEKMVQVCVNAGKLNLAFETVERSRSRLLLDLIASEHLLKDPDLPQTIKNLIEQFNKLQHEIDCELNQKLNKNQLDISNSISRLSLLSGYTKSIAELETRKQEVWEKILKHDSIFSGQTQLGSPSFSVIQSFVDNPTTAILSFYTTRRDTHIFVLRQNHLTVHTISGQGLETLYTPTASNWLRPYNTDVSQWQDQIQPVLLDLSKKLKLKDLISHHLNDIYELIIIPQLFLNLIPLAALPIEDGEYLGDRFLIRHVPSCQILQFCQNRPAILEPLIYGLVENATDDLPCAGFEGAQIAALYSITNEHRLQGSQQATVENFRQLAKAVNVLHCSHHARSRLDNPLHSELLLADGSITLGQLLTPGWRLPQLSEVFLSCCETHLGAPTVTDDILTLAGCRRDSFCVHENMQSPQVEG